MQIYLVNCYYRVDLAPLFTEEGERWEEEETEEEESSLGKHALKEEIMQWL